MGPFVVIDDARLLDQLEAVATPPDRDVIVDLGGCLVRLRVTGSATSILERFELVDAYDGAWANFEVSCLTPEAVPLALRSAVAAAGGRTVRARNLRRGYYATDNFGLPAEMVSDGRRFVVIAEDPEPVVWSYLLKHLLLRWSIERDSLFLKGAAIDWDGAGILLIARGGGGKTTMAMALAQLGGGLIANSHVLVDSGSLTGVGTTMRVRESDPADHGVQERLVAPSSLFARPAHRSVPLRLVCLVNRTEDTSDRVVRLSNSIAVPILTAYALGHDVYRLEEDLLDDLDGDYERYGRAISRMRSRLVAMAKKHPLVLVDYDVLRPGGAQTLADALTLELRVQR